MNKILKYILDNEIINKNEFGKKPSYCLTKKDNSTLYCLEVSFRKNFTERCIVYNFNKKEIDSKITSDERKIKKII